MAFKIYTKTGDSGTTGLYGGMRLSKDHIRIESYGTVDELNSYIGLVRDLTETDWLVEKLTGIQEVLFDIGSHLAAQPGKNLKLPELDENLPNKLEQLIDKMDEELEPLKVFILPGGSPIISHAHIARCICRRAERRVIALASQEEVHEMIVPFLNRLSDMLFTLARYYAHVRSIDEIPWTAGKHRL